MLWKIAFLMVVSIRRLEVKEILRGKAEIQFLSVSDRKEGHRKVRRDFYDDR